MIGPGLGVTAELLVRKCGSCKNSDIIRVNWPLFITVLPIFAAILAYRLDSFNPSPLPVHHLTQPPLKAPLRNGRMLRGSEFVGKGQLQGPEDIVFDAKSGLIYTSCEDGWIKRLPVNNSVVENWINTGGRPLGLALGRSGELLVADAYKGLLKISSGGTVVELLTHEADGERLKITDGVDVAEDGSIYLTDASSKYELRDVIWDLLEGRPYGRLLSYDPTTNTTTVLASDLYFANGVAVSPLQDFVVFCETFMKRCRRYYIQGHKKGSVEKFIDNLPGMPDNIHYGHGHYWIALFAESTAFWDAALQYPAIRKVIAMITRLIGRVDKATNSGVFVVDLEGKPVAHYHDPRLSSLTTGLKIGNYLYCGSLGYSHIIRLDLHKHPAT